MPYGWQQKGKQVCLLPRDSKRLNILGFLSPDNRLYTYDTEGIINSEFVIKSIEDLINQFDKPTVIVLDNAPIHRCGAFYDKLDEWQEKDVYIFFLPKYSPHLNIIEVLWRFIKYYWLKPKNFISWGRLKKAIKNIIVNYGQEFKINFTR